VRPPFSSSHSPFYLRPHAHSHPGVGACQDYLGQCGSPQTFKLPTDIQTAVCNEKIKIDDDIYTNGWPDGVRVFFSFF
jgi:hypothetical protein